VRRTRVERTYQLARSGWGTRSAPRELYRHVKDVVERAPIVSDRRGLENSLLADLPLPGPQMLATHVMDIANVVRAS
jgi:hypothetical protein